MATITPTLTITSNASSATSSPGPISTALSISATSSLTVDKLQANTLAVTTSEAILFDGDAESGGDGAGGTVGSFLYLRNATGSSRLIYIGIDHDGGSATNLAATDQADDGTATNAFRFLTLKDGEFAFLPWDYTCDLIVDADGAGTLEYFLFDR
jgi:hypothetical protein